MDLMTLQIWFMSLDSGTKMLIFIILLSAFLTLKRWAILFISIFYIIGASVGAPTNYIYQANLSTLFTRQETYVTYFM